MSEASFVVQAIVAPEAVIPDELTPLITGAVVSEAALSRPVNVKIRPAEMGAENTPLTTVTSAPRT